MNKNKISNKISGICACLFFVLITFSCTDKFEEYNRDPGRPTDKEIMEGYYKLGAFFPQMLNYAYPSQENAYQMGENLIGDPYGRYMSIANTWTATFSTFNAPASWIGSPFNDVYSKVFGGLTQVKQLTKGAGPLYAWAEIIKVTSIQRITDMYGPIPYSKIESGSIAVGYDSQEDVYKGMFNDLDTAINILTRFVKENPNYTAMADFDQVYRSDFKKWVKYANSLKLRMALRVVYADPVLAKQKAEEAVKHEFGVMELNTDNALNAFPQNPVWVVNTSWGDSRSCADIISYMSGYKDSRLSKYFTPSTVVGGPEYLGLRTGITVADKTFAGRYSCPTYKQADPTLWMCAAEIAFLRAEGALRGWNMGGNAKDMYEKGIKLSFEQWAASGADSYMQDDSSKPGDYADPDPKFAAKAISTITIKWNEADPFETKLERLITQKWIAMFPLGQEAWSEQRRTTYPRFFPTLVNSSDDANLTTRLASRIPFPPDEKNNNTDNYNEAVKMLGGKDNYSTKLWWDQNPHKGW